MMKTKKGFTIIELMVSVAIIAILTGIVVTNASQSRARSRDAKRISDINQLQLALELYFDRCGRYPKVSSGTNLPRIDDPNTVTGDPLLGCPSNITLQTFISQTPNPPKSGDYLYVINTSDANTPATDYVLQAKLERFNQALNDDLDGSVTLGGTSVDCLDGTQSSDPAYYYCVQPR